MFGLFKRNKRGGGCEPRLSDALRETGRYRIDYPGWRPMGLIGDPALVPDAPRAMGDRVSAELIATAPARAGAARAVLRGHGIAQLEGADDWRQAEPVLVCLLEPSAEPQHANCGPMLRPASFAFLVDAGCAYALTLTAAHPGAELAPAAAALSSFSRTGPVCAVTSPPRTRRTRSPNSPPGWTTSPSARGARLPATRWRSK